MSVRTLLTPYIIVSGTVAYNLSRRGTGDLCLQRMPPILTPSDTKLASPPKNSADSAGVRGERSIGSNI